MQEQPLGNQRAKTTGQDGERTCRLLGIVDSPVWPPRCGGDLRTWHLWTRLAKQTEASLLMRMPGSTPPGYDQAFLEEELSAQHVFLPRPGPVAKFGKAVRFLFSPFPLRAAGWFFTRFRRRLNRALNESPPDVVVMASTWLCAYWPLLQKASTCTVVDAFDLLSEVMARQAERSHGWKRLSLQLDARRMARIEQRMFSEADLVLTTSRREQQHVQQRVPGALVKVIPNGVDTRSLQPLAPVDSSSVLFVGALDYAPNREGLDWLMEQVWPRLLLQHPEARLVIVGRAPPPEYAVQCAARTGVTFVGEVEEVMPWYHDAALCVVPILTGGGTRLKILEAMALGRPVVTTSLGAEGLEVEDGQHLLVADDPELFAGGIVRLMEEGEARETMVQHARERVEQQYGWDALAHALAMELLQYAGQEASSHPD